MARLPSRSLDPFEKSIREYRSGLDEKQQQRFHQYATPEKMIDAITRQCRSSKQKNRLMICCKKLQTFSESFAPYFDVINIFVQVKPEWFGIFWGAIRLIFTLSDNYVKFLEKVADKFQDMSCALPRYEIHLTRCRKRYSEGDPDRLMRLMSLVYSDIIQFCHQTSQIFARGAPGARVRDRLMFVGGSLWNSFDSRFSLLLERMKQHAKLFKQEVYLEDQEGHSADLQSIKSMLEENTREAERVRLRHSAEEARRAAEKVSELKVWLGPTEYRRSYERARTTREPRSGDWLLQEKAYQTWRDAPFNDDQDLDTDPLQTSSLRGVLVLQGKPGYGKTYLSTTIIDDLESKADKLGTLSSTKVSVAFFHFEAGEPLKKTTQAAIRAFAVQLLHIHRVEQKAIDALTLLMDTIASGQTHASDGEILQVLEILLHQFPTYLVLDGIDECRDYNQLFGSISRLRQSLDTKFVLLSRPDINLPNRYRSYSPLIALVSSHNFEDIQAFLKERIESMIEDGLFGSEALQINSSPAHGGDRLPNVARSLRHPTGRLSGSSRITLMDHRSSGEGTWRGLGSTIASDDVEAELPIVHDSPGAACTSPGVGPTSLPAPAISAIGGVYRPGKHRISDKEDYNPAAKKLFDGKSMRPANASGGTSENWLYAEIALRSSGMWLWARLLVNYLSSPALSRIERHNVVFGINGFEGLDPLYTGILRKMSEKYVAERLLARKVFQWVSFAVFPLPIEAMQAAVAVKVGQPTAEADKIPALENAIPVITCALVEFDGSGRLRFIHSSFDEFLRTSMVAPREFSLLSTSAIHLDLAKACLTYLTYDMPPRPLHSLVRPSFAYESNGVACGLERTSRTRPEPTVAERRKAWRMHHPLLHYASMCWTTHLTNGLDTEWTVTASLWTTELSVFLLNRMTVTMWVEACWTLGLPPSLVRLTDAVGPHFRSLTADHLSSPSTRELVWTLTFLSTLARALEQLKHRGAELLAEPANIWLDTFTSAVDPNFWPVWRFDREQEPTEDGPIGFVDASHMPDYGNLQTRTGWGMQSGNFTGLV